MSCNDVLTFLKICEFTKLDNFDDFDVPRCQPCEWSIWKTRSTKKFWYLHSFIIGFLKWWTWSQKFKETNCVLDSRWPSSSLSSSNHLLSNWRRIRVIATLRLPLQNKPGYYVSKCLTRLCLFFCYMLRFRPEPFNGFFSETDPNWLTIVLGSMRGWPWLAVEPRKGRILESFPSWYSILTTPYAGVSVRVTSTLCQLPTPHAIHTPGVRTTT